MPKLHRFLEISTFQNIDVSFQSTSFSVNCLETSGRLKLSNQRNSNTDAAKKRRRDNSVLCITAIANDRVVVFAGTKQEKPGPKSGTCLKVQKRVLELEYFNEIWHEISSETCLQNAYLSFKFPVF